MTAKRPSVETAAVINELGPTSRACMRPGKWASYLFVIDNLDEYARAFGIVHDEKRAGLADHEHQVRWTIHPFENNPNGSYVTLEVRRLRMRDSGS